MAENYIVSARKYRPSTFRTVVGQQALTHTLKTAIASDRLAHAYLFCGPRGVGKTTCARIFAKTINCQHRTPEGEACNQCDSCQAFNSQSSFNIIEMDAASNNGVDQIRDLTEKVLIPPQGGRYKVYIIDEVHMLSLAAFNAFLKTLEEPPEYAIFILATTEKQKLLPTILSRCQIYDFTRITVPDIVAQLQYVCEQEGIEAEPAALNVIAQKADGGMRDALSIFDQVAASSQGHVTYRSAIDNLNILDYDYYFGLVDTFLAGNVPQALLTYREIRDKGFDSKFFVNGLAQHLRDLMVASTPQTRTLLEMNAEVTERYVQQAAKLPPGFYYRALDLCNTCDLNYRDASSKILLVELTLIKLCQIMVPAAAPVPPVPRPGIQKITPTAGQAPAQPTAAQPMQPAVAQQAAAQPMPAQPAAPQQPPTYHTPPAVQQVSEPQTQMGRPQPVAQHAGAATPMARVAVGAAAPVGVSRPVIKGVQRPASMAANAPQPGGEQPATTLAAPVRQAAFTEQQLLDAWHQYIATHQHEKALASTMDMALPEKITDTQYRISVASQGQAEFFSNARAELLPALRQAVGNDLLDIEVQITEGTGSRRVWHPREVVENVKQHNPKFNDFLSEFQLGLA